MGVDKMDDYPVEEVNRINRETLDGVIDANPDVDPREIEADFIPWEY